MNLRFLSALVLAPAAVALAMTACGTTNTVLVVSGEGGSGDGGPLVEPEEAGPAEDAAPQTDAPESATNPYGVPYPTDNIGTKTRVGSVAGSVIANLKWTGYVPNASSTSSVQLADLFDPQGKTHDIVALILNSRWDTVGTQLVNQLKTSGMPTRVASVTVLGEGTSPGTPSTLSDLSGWRTQFGQPSMWTLLDPGFAQFPTAIYDKTAVPAFIILDARTMEIVSAELGSPPQPRTALETFRDEVKNRPPSY